MDNSESGDELTGTFLTTDAGYMVQADDMDGTVNTHYLQFFKYRNN